MKQFCFLLLVTLIVLLTVACSARPASPRPEPAQPALPVPISKPAWQEDWEKTLAAAKNEGNVVITTSFTGDTRDAMAKAFKEKYGLDMEFVAGRASGLLPKLQSERRAGLYLEDLTLEGITAILPLRDLGFLDPLKPVLVLPEVLDPTAWMDGRLRFVDKEDLVLSYQISASGPIYINTDIVKPDEIKSFRDLLNPRWKGKIVALDPTIGASGTTFFFLLWELMGPEFTRELAKQDLTIVADARLQGEWLARGKYPVSGNIDADMYAQFLQSGAPIKLIIPIEGSAVTTSKGGLGFYYKAPHPNAARVFINWLLTREAQTLVSKITGTPSRRLDVSLEGIDPSKIIQPGIRYIEGDSEEAVKKKEEMKIISRDVWNVKK